MFGIFAASNSTL